MRNLSPSPKFSVLVATVVVVTLAVWPVGYAEAERVSAWSQKQRQSAEGGDTSLKSQRSVGIRDRGPDQSPIYQTWDGEDDDFYAGQSDPSESNTYEDDGYGYDDDEYDHFNYKRYDGAKSNVGNIDDDMKTSNEETAGAVEGGKRSHMVIPEATTIELLSFQAKTLDPKSESMEPVKEEVRLKPFVAKKPLIPDKSEEKETLLEEKQKKKMFEAQKSEDANGDKNTGNAKVSENKPPETKEPTDNKVEKGKMTEAGISGSSNVRNVKENVEIADSKDQSVSASDSKNEAKITEKDVEAPETKFRQEEKNGVKVKAEKYGERKADDEGAVADDSVDKDSSSQFGASPLENDYKDGLDDSVMADDEKDSEDNGMNLVGLRDSRNELAYRYPNTMRSAKLLKKKETSRRAPGARSAIRNSDGKALAGGSRFASGAKEPFHLEFPVSDLESPDYRHNYLKSLKRFKNIGESARILDQGDTPSPYADEAKKYLAPKVIEEEQRKRRSRLRRLKADSKFNADDAGDEDMYDYGYPPSVRSRYGVYRRNTLGQGHGQPPSSKSHRRRGIQRLGDGYGDEPEDEPEASNNAKNKRQDSPGFYVEEDESYAEKRKSHGKSSWGGETTTQKKKMKDANLYEESGRYNSPLVLLQRNDNGQQAMKTFVDGRLKNEDGVDADDLARLLSRDSNYVVLKKVPAREPSSAVIDGSNLKSLVTDTRKKAKITHSDMMMKAQHSSDSKDADVGKFIGALKEDRGNRPLKGKETRIENLGDFFKGDADEDRNSDDKKEMISVDNHQSQFHRGEINRMTARKSSHFQAFRHMKDLNESEKGSDTDTSVVTLADKCGEKERNEGQAPERLLKSFRKNGKEFLIINKSYGPVTVKESTDANGMGNVASNSATNSMANIAAAQMSGTMSNGVMMGVPNAMGTSTYQNSMPSANAYQNAMTQGAPVQEVRPDQGQKGMDANRNYYAYSSENEMSNTPKHEGAKIMQGGFSQPPNSYGAQNYNLQYYNWQNYNKAQSAKSAQSGKVQTMGGKKEEDPYATFRQAYNYGKAQQCLANGGFPRRDPSSEAAEDLKRITKKDESSDNLERFIRDFQDFSQTSYPLAFQSTGLPGMTLQELTSHGDRQLRKLNSILKEIMNSKGDGSASDRALKTLKRGMFQKKYKDQKNWSMARGAGDAQVRSGKWTSVVYDGSNQLGFSEKSNSPGEAALKDRKLEGKEGAAMLNKDMQLSKRVKRVARFDSKDSTKMIEQKVKSTPCRVQLQPLFPVLSNAGGSPNSDQHHRSLTRSSIQLPQEKLMDLLNFFRSEREESDEGTGGSERLCVRRSAPAEDKSAASPSSSEKLDEAEKKRAECIRKSFGSYLDPLVKKIMEHEGKVEDGEKRRKREIELDESMPNDFQNFLVTSVGSFGSQKRGVVKKDEAVWDSEGNREESTLGKRDTGGNSRSEQDTISRKDATNIRIKIVDGNGNGELEAKASEGSSPTKEAKTAKVAPNGGDANVHEVYLITNADAKRRKKKKFVSDQSPQKQPITNHLPHVETVYNPSPGNNKAQVEKISGDQIKGKFPQPQTMYNTSASMMEDNIIRNNLRTGNINTFTYQRKEEPTPYPVQSPTNPPSSEFEMLSSKSLSKSKSKPINSQTYDFGDRDMTATTANDSPEIVYKDQTLQKYKSVMNKGVSLTRPDHRFNPMARVFKFGGEGSGLDRCRKDYGEESPNSEYDDGESFSEEIAERQAYQDYDDQESGKQGSRRQDAEEFSRAQEHLNPKMVALWNEYARTHLSPERHKEAMEREFREAYYRSNLQSGIDVGNLNQLNLGVHLQNTDSLENGNTNEVTDHLERHKTREKLSKRRLNPKNSQPVQIGKRFFFTYKSELPDDVYYSLYKDRSNPSKTMEVGPRTRFFGNGNNGRVRNADGWKAAKATVPVQYLADDFQRSRAKRSDGDAASPTGSNIVKRISSGRLTESHYQKFHKKNLNVKLEGDPKESHEKSLQMEREKRDSLTDYLKSDMMKRIEVEKKVRSKVKGLTSDMNEFEIPMIGVQREVPPPGGVPHQNAQSQQVDEAKKKDNEKATGPNSQEQKEQQQLSHQYGHLKSGNPDVFKTFDVKRGRRDQCDSRAVRKRTLSEGVRHAIFGRAGSTAYQDKLFLKDVKTRKVKKYSNEGFEPLKPDARFSDRSNFYSGSMENADGPFRVPLEEKASTSGINRRAGDRMSKAKQSSSGGHQKLQKLTHGFSHEAPLLTAGNPLNSPGIFDALKGSPSSKEDVSLRKTTSENALRPSDVRDGSHLKSDRASAAASKEPLVSAVLVLAKREDLSGSRIDTKYPSQSSFRLAEREEMTPGEGEEMPSAVEKRKAQWPKGGGGDGSRCRSANQCSDTVNDDNEIPNTDFETTTNSQKNEMVSKDKTFYFPSTQYQHDRNNEGGTGFGNPGEDILESILGTVEANPHFRRVIGPGLKWRRRKCYSEANTCKMVPPYRSTFYRRVKKILAKFVRDIEKVAAQDLSQGICRKLDIASDKFLRELLDVPAEYIDGSCKRRKFLEVLMKEPYGVGELADKDFATNPDFIGVGQSRRDLVERLLEEYRGLPDSEKRSVEILGQYLNHELDTLNKALNIAGTSPIGNDEKQDDRASPPDSLEGAEGNTEKVGIASDVAPEAECDSKRASERFSHAWSKERNLELGKDDLPPSSGQINQVPKAQEFAAPFTESTNTGSSDESAGTATFSGWVDRRTQHKRRFRRPGGFAGFRHSLRSRNMSLAKGKPGRGWRWRKQRVGDGTG